MEENPTSPESSNSSSTMSPSNPFAPTSPINPLAPMSPFNPSAPLSPLNLLVPVSRPYPQSPMFDMDDSDETQPMPERNVVNEDSSDSNATVRYDIARPHSPVLVPANDDSNATVVNEDSSSVNPPEMFEAEDSRPFSFESCSTTTKEHSRPDIEEPPAKIRKLTPSQEEQDGENCPICLDSWGNSGEHRLVALKCGHLFGANCVQRWLKAQTAKDRTCPTCKSKATTRDMRFIYARKLIAADTSEITTLQKQNETLQAEKNRCEMELQKTKIAHRACLQQLEAMKNAMKNLQAIPEKSKKSWRFALEKNLEISRDGGCRVCSYNCRTYELYVSQKSTNNLFPGFGVRRISCVDYKLNQFIHLHTKPIRDIVYSQPKDLFISVSLDKTLRVIERGVATMNIETTEPLWSCAWDRVRHDEFYVGGFRGIVYKYDIRNTSSFLQQFVMPLDDKSQIISLYSTEYGLLAGSIISSYLYVPGANGLFEPKALPVDGPFLPVTYDHESNRAAVTCRPKNGERSKVVVCKFEGTVNGETSCFIEQSFPSSTTTSIISRPSWVKSGQSSWVAGYSESDKSIVLNGLDGARSMSLPSAEAAFDLCSMQINSDTILAALSETRLRLYKAVPTA